MKSKKLNNKIAIQEGVISVVFNTLLFGLKLWAGIISGSVALKADAWHTLSDSISSIIVIIAARFSMKPADKSHPFGHGRAGLIASLFIGFLLVVIGFEFAKQGVERLMLHETAHFGAIAIWVTVISIASKEALAQFAYWGFRKTGDESLRADGWHHRSDALSSVVVLIGILLGGKIWWIDSVLSFAIALLMMYAAYSIVIKGIETLLGEEPTEELTEELKKMCIRCLGSIAGLHHVHLHRYGDHTEITFHVRLNKNLNLKEAHDQVEILEDQIRSELQLEPTIHIEPDLLNS